MRRMADDPLQAKLFRQQAIAAIGQSALGEVVAALPPRAPAAAAVGVLACVLLVASTAVVHVPERIPAVGLLQPAGRITPVLAPRAGIVEAVAVADGHALRRGQRLLDIRAAGTDAPQSLLEAERRSLERELRTLDEESAADERAYGAAVAAADRRVAATHGRRDAAEAEARLLAERTGIAERRLARARRLLESGGIAAHQLDTLAADVVESRVAEAAALARQHSAGEEAERLSDELRQRRAAFDQRRLERERDRQRLHREVLRLGDRARSPVLASADGTAGALLVGEGSPVQAGQLLLQLFAADSELEAHLFVAADHAGRVRAGQRIELRLRAWPYALYGTLAATVRAVASVPVPAASLPNRLPVEGAVFEVRAEPDAGELADWPALGPGATFDTDVVIRRWPLYEWLLRAGRPGG